MRRVLRVRLFAGAALLAALVLASFARYAAGAIVGVAGLATLLLVPEEEIERGLADRSQDGAQRALAGLVKDLRLTGPGIVIPGEGPAPSTLYIPTREAGATEVPKLVEGVHIYREGGAVGIAIPPPASGLEATIAREGALPRGLGLEEAAVSVKRALESMGLARDVAVSRSGSIVRITYSPLEFRETCRLARDELAPWHLQGGCPSCSLAAILVARSVGAPVRVHAAGEQGDTVFLDLEVDARSPA